jgi:hypothetical protein
MSTTRKAFEAYVEFCNKVWQNKAIKADWGLNDVWQAATLAERERAAKIAETPFSGEQDDITMQAKDRIAAAIRKEPT